MYTTKDVLEEMLAIHESDMMSVQRRSISYSPGFHHLCTRFSDLTDLIGPPNYEKIYREGYIPLISSSTLKRHLNDDTLINVSDGLTMSGAIAAFENCKLAFETEWKKLPTTLSQKVKEQTWYAFRIILLAEDEAATNLNYCLLEIASSVRHLKKKMVKL